MDGEKGILRYRGIPIEELASIRRLWKRPIFSSNGELPNLAGLDEYPGAAQ